MLPDFPAAAETLADLPLWVQTKRARYGLTLADAASQIGTSKPAVARLERGLNCHAYTALLALRWLGRHP